MCRIINLFETCMLHPLIDNAGLEVWVDTRIQPGKWQPQIDAAMSLLLLAIAFFATGENERGRAITPVGA